MPTRSMHVWLHGVRIARLSEPSRFRLRLDFTEEALDTFGEGSCALSLALPIRSTSVSDSKSPGSPQPVSAFVQGLLPEGNLRQHIAATAGIATTDIMGLLNLVGAECAGAVQILHDDAQPTQGTIRPLSNKEVATLVADLPTYHLPNNTTLQASLAGIQDKVLLVSLPRHKWGWPEFGAPSTHIIKPEPVGGAIGHLIQTEHWALHVAQASGLPAADSRLATFNERQAIIVTRYDRDSDGERLHQEDFCQALGLNPRSKYESTAETLKHGSRLKRIARAAAARSPDPDAFRAALLRAVTFNVIIGSGDAHSKNYSLLIDRVGRVSLAPLYDTAPTAYLNAKYKGTGHVINGKTSIDTVSVEDLSAEAGSWGTSTRRAREIVTTCMAEVHAAAVQTALPPGAEFVLANLEKMWTRRAWSIRP